MRQALGSDPPAAERFLEQAMTFHADTTNTSAPILEKPEAKPPVDQRVADHSEQPSAGEITRLLAAYRRPGLAASLFQLLVTLGLWAAMWPIMWWSLGTGYWLTLLLAVPAACFSVRLFILQHDCGHGSFFRSRRANEWVGRLLAVVTLTPYHCWRRQHATHHANTGNLDRRGLGDLDTRTVSEYLAMSWFGRLRYRLYRHPLVLFGIGPFFQFAVWQRLTIGLPKTWRRERLSVHLTNLVLLTVMGALILLFDWRSIVLLYLPVMAMATSIGVWLFYVQHQFNPTYWRHDPQWDYRAAAVEGSSYYHLPAPLRWLTANIGFHHLHHLDSRIPNYRLPKIYRNHPALRKADRLSLWSSLRCAFYKLWDEKHRRLVSFRQAARSTG
jgi:omega-6 fatty acid desaturase (delta-12 desaturase)